MQRAKRAIGPPIPPAAYRLGRRPARQLRRRGVHQGFDGDPHRQVLAVIHELGETCVCVSLAFTIQSRNVRDFSTSLDQVSRLRREGIATDKGAGPLSQVLEETLVNTKQILGIQPWISRAPARPFFNPNQRIGANLANVTELKQFWAALRGRRASSMSASTRWWSTVRR